MRNISILAAVLAVLLFIYYTPVNAQEEPMLKLKLEPLTLSGDLYSVSVTQDAVIAVGKGRMVLVWRQNSLNILTVASSDLLSVSCGNNVCVAVGRDGVVAETYPFELTYRTLSS